MKTFKVGDKVTVKRYKGLSYDLSYDEILCFGGPDGTVKEMDKQMKKDGVVGVVFDEESQMFYEGAGPWIVEVKNLKEAK